MNNLVLVAVTVLVITGMIPTSAEGQRRPLQLVPITVQILEEEELLGSRWDPDRGQLVSYVLNGKLEPDRESGNLVLSWDRTDGQRQELVIELRNKVLAVVSADVSFDEVTGLYTYRYEAANMPASPQEIRTLIVEANGFESVGRPDETWYSRRLTEFLKGRLDIGEGWAWSRVFGGFTGIPPGESAGGFEVVSPHPPAIVACVVFGGAGLPRLAAGAEEVPESMERVLGQILAQDFRRGVTLGPVRPDPSTSPGAALEEAHSMLEVAGEEGWLGPVADAERVRGALAAVRATAESGDLQRSRAHIISTLEAVRGGAFAGVLPEGRVILESYLERLSALAPG